MRLLTAIHPHSQFRGAEVRVDRVIEAGADANLTLTARFDESPNTVVENPFLILTVDQDGTMWRVLARVRVIAGARGEPTAAGDVFVSANRAGAT